MKGFILSITLGFALSITSLAQSSVADDATASSRSASKTQSVLDDSSKAGKFTFIVFYRDDSSETRQMYDFVSGELDQRKQQAVIVSAKVTDPAERELVNRFGINRAPMPLTVAVAPNGAITGLFPREIRAEHVDASIVPPTMMRCMKHLQDQKLVFVCLTKTDRAAIPPGVKDLQADPDFKDRISLVSMRATDEKEQRFLSQMKVDAEQVEGAYAVLIAPPGVLVGHFDATFGKDDIAAAIHKAGRCCDDENCKHNRPTAPQAKRPANSGRN